MRLALGVEYNGSLFHGWQSQQSLTTIQNTLETAFSCIGNEPIKIVCAGRTDAGVHATHQVIHFDTSAKRSLAAWVDGTNSQLPASISIQWVTEVDSHFHARFSALSRRYHYVIYNNPIRSSLYSSLATWINQDLDIERMHTAAQVLIGEHDFSSFRSASCQSKTPRRHVFAISVVRQNQLVVIDMIANSFLHKMVRNIVGVLIDIGLDKRPIDWCRQLLTIKNRAFGSRTALPGGLYLTGVRYADSYNLPSSNKIPIFTVPTEP